MKGGEDVHKDYNEEAHQDENERKGHWVLSINEWVIKLGKN